MRCCAVSHRTVTHLLQEGNIDRNKFLTVPAIAQLPTLGQVGAACGRSSSCVKPWTPFQWVQTSLDCTSVNLDRFSSRLSFAVCGCHSYKVSLPLIPPLHGERAQTHFSLGPRSPLPIACMCIAVTLRLPCQHQCGSHAS